MANRILSSFNTITPEKCNTLRTAVIICFIITILIAIIMLVLGVMIYQCSKKLKCVAETYCTDVPVNTQVTIVNPEVQNVCAMTDDIDKESRCKKYLKTYIITEVVLAGLLVLVNAYGIFVYTSKKECIVQD